MKFRAYRSQRAIREDVAPNGMGPNSRPAAPSIAIEEGLCPRCDDILRQGYYEPYCLTCGFVDYFSSTPSPPSVKTAITSALISRARYGGEEKRFQGIVIDVEVQRRTPSLVHMLLGYSPHCPWCRRVMTETMTRRKEGKDGEESLFRFRCRENHKIKLRTDAEGLLVWS